MTHSEILDSFMENYTIYFPSEVIGHEEQSYFPWNFGDKVNFTSQLAFPTKAFLQTVLFVAIHTGFSSPSCLELNPVVSRRFEKPVF